MAASIACCKGGIVDLQFREVTRTTILPTRGVYLEYECVLSYAELYEEADADLFRATLYQRNGRTICGVTEGKIASRFCMVSSPRDCSTSPLEHMVSLRAFAFLAIREASSKSLG